MAYGMELFPKNGVTTVLKSYNGVGEGKIVVAINGTIITGFSRFTVKELVDSLTETRQNIRLLLEGGSIVIYSPNSAPQDWDRLRQTEQA